MAGEIDTDADTSTQQYLVNTISTYIVGCDSMISRRPVDYDNNDWHFC